VAVIMTRNLHGFTKNVDTGKVTFDKPGTTQNA